MSGRLDENGRLTSLLQALPVPEPSTEFLAGTRRRYLEAVEARDRHHVLIGLVTALVGLAVTAALLGAAAAPVTLVAWLAEAAADLARWLAGIGVVVALVPLPIWVSAVLGSTAAVLAVPLIARARLPTVVK